MSYSSKRLLAMVKKISRLTEQSMMTGFVWHTPPTSLLFRFAFYNPFKKTSPRKEGMRPVWSGNIIDGVI